MQLHTCVLLCHVSMLYTSLKTHQLQWQNFGMKKPWKQRLIEVDDNRASVAKDLLDHSRIFLKLDFGYLIALGAVFTGLKLEVDDVLSNFGTFSFLPWFFSVVVTVDAGIYLTLYEDWAKLRNRAPRRWEWPALQILMRFQVLLHLAFFMHLLVSVTGYAQGSFDQIKRYEAMARIQNGVDLAIIKTGKVPENLSELPQKEYYLSAISKLGLNNISIKHTEGKSYTLIFAGNDGQFGTRDDDEYTDKVSASDIYDQLWGKK